MAALKPRQPKTEREPKILRPEVPPEAPKPEIKKPPEAIEKARRREVGEAPPPAAPLPRVAPLPTAPPPKDKVTREIEKILEEDLRELYLNLPRALQKEFKQKGEETAVKIRELVRKTKIKVSQILKLIKEWLQMIPGINRFFLEQESKIKTDKIIRLAEREKKKM